MTLKQYSVSKLALSIPLPHVSILGSSNSTEKKIYDVKNMDKWGYNYPIEQKTLCEKKKLLVTSNFFFSHNVFKSCLLLMRQNEYLWSKGLYPKILIQCKIRLKLKF